MNAIKTHESRASIDKRRSSVFSAFGDQGMVCSLLENALPGSDPAASIQSSSLPNSNKDGIKNELLLKQIRRKSKNFKDLVANYWNSTAATKNDGKASNASSREAVAKQLQLRRKSEESIFGMFHPIDLTSSGSNHDSSSPAIRAERTASMSGPLFPSIDILGIEKHILRSSSSSPNHKNTNAAVIPEPATSLSAVSAAERVSASGGSVHSSNTTNTDADTIGTVESNSNSNIISEPGPYDIVCGRNNGAYNYIGNRRFRVTIEMNLQRYIESPSREDRTNVIKSIVWMLREQVGARFLKKETFKKSGSGRRRQPQYTIMTEKQAREKVGHCLRDLIAAARKGEPQEKKIKC